MARPRQDITDAELAVLQSLWSQSPATIRQLTDQLYPRGSNSHFATVQKLLERLETKGFVRRQRDASSLQFHPIVSLDEFVGRRLKMLAEKLCDGSLTPLLMHLVSSRSLAKDERQKLRALVDQLDRDHGHAH